MTRNPKFHLNIAFGEALERYASTNPAEIQEAIKRAKREQLIKPKRKAKRAPAK